MQNRSIKFAEKWYLPALLLILATGLALRIAVAAHVPMWFDEYASLLFAQQPFARLWSEWMVRETNPPLFYSLVKVWQGVVGHNTLALRMPSVVAGTLAIGLVAEYCRRNFGAAVALLAAAIVAIGWTGLQRSHELRGYAFTLDLVFIAFWSICDWSLRSDVDWRRLSIFAVCMVAACYLHTTMLLVLAGMNLAIIVSGYKQLAGRRLVAFAVTNAVIAVLVAWSAYITWLQIRSPAVMANVSWIHPLDITGVFYDAIHVTTLLIRWGGNEDNIYSSMLFRIVIVNLAVIIIHMINHHDKPDERIKEILIFIAIIVVIFVLCSLKSPILNRKTTYFLVPFVAIIVAYFACSQPWRVVSWISAVAILGIIGANTINRFDKLGNEDWNILRQVAADRDGVLLISHDSLKAMTPLVCEQLFGHTTCPFPVIAISSSVRTNSWAFGLAPGMLDPDEARRRISVLPGESRLYSVRMGNYDPRVELGWPETPIDRAHPYLMLTGPLSKAQVLAATGGS